MNKRTSHPAPVTAPSGDRSPESANRDASLADSESRSPTSDSPDWRAVPIVAYAVVGHKLASLLMARPPVAVIAVGGFTISSERRDDGDGPFVRVEVGADHLAADHRAASAGRAETDAATARTLVTSLKEQIERLKLQIDERAREITGPVERANAVKDEMRETGMADPDPNQTVPDPERNANYRAAKAQCEEHLAEYRKKLKAAEADLVTKKRAADAAKVSVPAPVSPVVYEVPLDEIDVSPVSGASPV